MAGESPRKLIDAAAAQHDVDLDQAVVAQDDNPDSDRIYIIEDLDSDGYRLIGFGLDGDDRPANEQPIHIPGSAVGAVQGLLHAAGMHVTNQGMLTGGGEPDISIRELSEGRGLSKPLNTEADQGDHDGR